MKLSGEAVILRVYVTEGDRCGGVPLFEAIIHKALELGLAGATAFRGIMGFGADCNMHAPTGLKLTQNLPILVEIVDREQNINRILPFLDDNVPEGLITLERVGVIKYVEKRAGVKQ